MRKSKFRCLSGLAFLYYATSMLFADTLSPCYSVTLLNGEAVVNAESNDPPVFASSNHREAIQWAIDHLPPDRTSKMKVQITGEYTTEGTIVLPSYTSIELDGKITLAAGVNAAVVGERQSEEGETDIEMIGGTYDGNKWEQEIDTSKGGGPGYYCILFKQVRNSVFKNFTTQNYGKDGFILDTKCHDNVCSNLIGRWSGYPEKGIFEGNGLGDRGTSNEWTDCLATDTANDCWVIKCRKSTFTRCVARNQLTGGAFGLFCDNLIADNKFYDCEAVNCHGRALTLRKPNNPAKGPDPIRDNYFEIYVHDNGSRNGIEEDQVAVRLWCSRDAIKRKELIRNNEMHLLIANNYREGFYIKESHVEGTTGTIVAYGNEIDAIVEGHHNNLTFLVPDVTTASITDKGSRNKVVVREIKPSDKSTSWAARKYYELLYGTEEMPPAKSEAAAGGSVVINEAPEG